MKTPYPYQLDAIELGLIRSALIADECGLGKTLVGIEIARRRQGPALFVVPKSTVPQWTAAILDQTGHPPIRILAHTPIVPDPDQMYLTHYEVLLSLGDHLSHFAWGTVVADEVHRIKDRRALRTKALKRLRSTRRIGLTGTPIEKSPADLWSILHWLHPGYFNSYWRFCDHYVQFQNIYRGAEVYRKIVGGKNLEELAEQLQFCMLRRTKQEVAPELPEKIVQYVDVEMDPSQELLYNALALSRDIEVELPGYRDTLVVKNELAKITYLQMISSFSQVLPIKGSPGASAKMEWLNDFVRDNPEEPMVVFTRFRGSAEIIRDWFAMDAALLIGGDRDEAQRFLDGKRRILVGTIDAMGEGLNLQRARTAIFFEAEWSATKMSQAVDRIHRIDITEPKNIIYLTASPIDRLILDAVEHKWTESELVAEFIRRQHEHAV